MVRRPGTRRRGRRVPAPRRHYPARLSSATARNGNGLNRTALDSVKTVDEVMRDLVQGAFETARRVEAATGELAGARV